MFCSVDPFKVLAKWGNLLVPQLAGDFYAIQSAVRLGCCCGSLPTFLFYIEVVQGISGSLLIHATSFRTVKSLWLC